MKPAVPILRVFDEDKALEFYRDFLGFAVEWTHRFEEHLPAYAQVGRDGCRLHLSEHHGDGTPGTRVRIETDALDALCKELLDRDYAYCRPSIEQMPWGERSFTVVDPFGNALTFFQPDTPSPHARTKINHT